MEVEMSGSREGVERRAGAATPQSPSPNQNIAEVALGEEGTQCPLQQLKAAGVTAAGGSPITRPAAAAAARSCSTAYDLDGLGGWQEVTRWQAEVAHPRHTCCCVHQVAVPAHA